VKIVEYSPYALARDTGTANIILGWCEALARRGCDVTLLIDGEQISRPCPTGVQCVPVKHRFRRRLMLPTRVHEHLGSVDLLVVHGGFVGWNIVACRAALAADVPCLITPHGVYNPRLLDRRRSAKSLWNLILERRHLQKAVGVHLHDQSELEGLRRLGVTLPAVITPNGISASDEVRWDGGSGGFLVYLGRFDVHVKALDILVQSFAHISESDRPTLRLHGPDHRGGKALVDALIRDLGLERWISVEDPIYGAAKRELLTRAAGCVYPSRWDAWPMAVSEAVGAGVPTLVADYPLGRLLAEERAAVLCERSPDGIARGIQRLLSEEGAEASRRGRDLASGRLSWDTLATAWIDEVSRMLQDRAVL
jgi:glycosyltransferase involved in cell wall biosynthesis